MDSTFWLLLIFAFTMAAVACHAHRIGNERRDVAALGVFAGLLGLGSGLTAIL